MVCDDYSVYKACFKSGRVVGVGCMTHARRKFHELHVTGKSQVAEQALVLIQKIYAIEAELRKETDGTAKQRREYRQQHSLPVIQQLYEWLKTLSHDAVEFSNCQGDQLHAKALASFERLSE